MPVVQRYGQRQVGTAPLPGVRKTAAETPLSQGAGLAEAKAHVAGQMAGAFGFLGQVGQQIVEEEYRRADEAALLEAENKLASWEHARLYDPERGALAVHGKDSFGLPETVAGEYAEVTSEIEGALTTPRQKEAFARIKAQRGQSIDLALRRHVFTEMERHEASELKAFIDNASAAAVANATDPRRVAEELARIEEKIRVHGPRAGLGKEALEAAQGEARSRVHVGVIDRLLAQDKPGAAKAYYEETRDQIHDPDGRQTAQIERALDEGGLRQQSQQKADEIMASTATAKDALAAAREVKDPQLRDEVVGRVRQRWAERDQIERDEHEEMLTRAANIIDQTRDFDRVPPGDIAKMSVQERVALEAYAKHKRQGNLETNWELYYSLKTQAVDDPQAFSAENLVRYRHQLEDTEWKELVAIQVSIRGGNREQATKALQDFRTESQLLDDSLRLAGIDPDDNKSPHKTAIAYLRRQVGETTAALQAQVGRKLTNIEVQGVIDSVLMQTVTIRGSWWNVIPGGKPFFDETKSLLEVTAADIPRDERKQIDEALRKAGMPVNDDTVLFLYLETQRRTRTKQQQGETR